MLHTGACASPGRCVRHTGICAANIAVATVSPGWAVMAISLGLVVQLTLGTSIGETASTVLAGVLMVSFVLFSGLRSAAFAAAVKDVLMVVLVVILAVTVANKVGAASMLDVFRLAEERFPGIGSLPGLKPEAGTSTVWLMTAALNIALGNWVFPHLFQISYAAGSPVAIRRNAIWQPIYSLSFFFIVLIGFAALLAGTEPPNGNANAALLQFVSDKYDPWVVGLLAGTGFLLALAPGSVLLLTASSILTRNLVAPLRPGLSEKASLRISQVGLVGIAALAVWISLTQKGSLVNILLGAYSAVGMLEGASEISAEKRACSSRGGETLMPVNGGWRGSELAAGLQRQGPAPAHAGGSGRHHSQPSTRAMLISAMPRVQTLPTVIPTMSALPAMVALAIHFTRRLTKPPSSQLRSVGPNRRWA